MRNYAINGSCGTIPAADTTNGIIKIIGAATVQPGIFEINSGSSAAPANQALEFRMLRFTAIGTNQTAVVAQALDPGAGTAVAAVTTACLGSSALPTYTNTIGILQWAQNQNTAYRWVASSPSRMLKIPSTTAAGIGMCPSVSTAQMAWSFGISIEE